MSNREYDGLYDELAALEAERESFLPTAPRRTWATRF